MSIDSGRNISNMDMKDMPVSMSIDPSTMGGPNEFGFGFFAKNAKKDNCLTQSIVSSGSNRTSKAVKKTPEQEFFEMTVLSFQLCHSNSKTIFSIDRNKMYDECRRAHKSFHLWPEWINSTLTRIVLNEKYN